MTKLLSKIQNISLDKFLYPKTLQPHPKAKVCDVVRLACDDGANLDIVTFRTRGSVDKKGTILRRFFVREKDGNELITERNYKKLKSTEICDPEDVEIIEATGRKISTIRKFNGKFLDKSEETQSVANRIDRAPVVTIKKVSASLLEKGVEQESQSLFQYKKGEKPYGFLVQNIVKDKFGFNKEKGEHIYSFSGISKRVANSFKKDPFFLLHLYSKKEFKKVAPLVVQNPNHKLQVKPEIHWYDGGLDDSGFCCGDVFLNKQIVVTKPQIVAVSVHEKEHSFQIQNGLLYLLEKGVDCFNFINIKPEFIAKCKKAFLEKGVRSVVSEAENKKIVRTFETHKSSVSLDFNEYKHQYVEYRAFQTEGVALNKYLKSVKNLDSKFPFAMNGMVNLSFEEREGLWFVKKGDSYVAQLR